jgi:hypothetical protein
MSVLQRILSPVVNRLVLALWWQMSRHWRLVSKPVVSSIIGDVAAHILAHQYESSVCNLSLTSIMPARCCGSAKIIYIM